MCEDPCNQYCPTIGNDYGCGLPEWNDIKKMHSEGFLWECHSQKGKPCSINQFVTPYLNSSEYKLKTLQEWYDQIEVLT